MRIFRESPKVDAPSESCENFWGKVPNLMFRHHVRILLETPKVNAPRPKQFIRGNPGDGGGSKAPHPSQGGLRARVFLTV